MIPIIRHPNLVGSGKGGKPGVDGEPAKLLNRPHGDVLHIMGEVVSTKCFWKQGGRLLTTEGARRKRWLMMGAKGVTEKPWATMNVMLVKLVGGSVNGYKERIAVGMFYENHWVKASPEGVMCGWLDP
jgi:hypothetical protein